MIKKIVLLSLLIFILVLSVQTAFAIKVYLRPPRMILYTNVTPGIPSEASGWFEIKNLNEEVMKVQFLAADGLEGITTFNPDVSEIEPNETKKIHFIVTVSEPGLYEGRVNVLYSINSTDSSVNSTVVQADVSIRADEVEASSPIGLTGNIISLLSNPYLVLVLVGIGIVLLLTSILVVKRTRIF